MPLFEVVQRETKRTTTSLGGFSPILAQGQTLSRRNRERLRQAHPTEADEAVHQKPRSEQKGNGHDRQPIGYVSNIGIWTTPNWWVFLGFPFKPTPKRAPLFSVEHSHTRVLENTKPKHDIRRHDIVSHCQLTPNMSFATALH